MRIPIIAAIVLFLLGLLIDFYIYFDIRRLHKVRGKWQARAYAISAIATQLLLIVALLWPRRSGDTDILPVMWMMFSWLTIYAGKLVYSLISLLGRLISKLLHREINLNLYVGIPAGLLVFGVMWWGSLVTRNDIEIKRVTVSSEKLPAAFDGYRIVQISDLHVGTWGDDTTFISHLVDTVNSLKPDVIFFTGDIVNRTTKEIYPFLSPLSRLNAPDGVYSILGNHDYGDYITWENEDLHKRNNQELIALQDSIRWQLLNNNHRLLTRENPVTENIDTIAVIGIGNWGEGPFKQYADMKAAYPDYHDGRFKILLSHNPKQWRAEITGKTTIDLMLSGHTHAMQFVINTGKKRWSPSGWRYPEWGGLYSAKDNGTEQYMYVNIGAGEVGMPFRIGATPEVTLITLRR